VPTRSRSDEAEQTQAVARPRRGGSPEGATEQAPASETAKRTGLPRTGVEAGLIALAGTGLLLAGSGLKRIAEEMRDA
jgi:hypothetical protein